MSAERIVSGPRAVRQLSAWQAQGFQVVRVAGVFDLIQVGHVRALRAASQRGDRLLVAVHGDEAAAALAGLGRPVVAARDRSALVAGLRGVDLVVVVESRAESLALGSPESLIDEAWGDPVRDLVARLRAGEDPGV